MNQPIKDRVRYELGQICNMAYGTGFNEVGEIQTSDGKLLKWAIRDSKAHEDWYFSITLAMALSAFVQQSAEEIAGGLARDLAERTHGPWRFMVVCGYINVYFEPRFIHEYIDYKEPLDWEALKALKGGTYAYYRLHTILKALKARGTVAKEDKILEQQLKEHPLHRLFNYPDISPRTSQNAEASWEKWINTIEDMTRLGYLRGLDREMETTLMEFLKACLN